MKTPKAKTNETGKLLPLDECPTCHGQFNAAMAAPSAKEARPHPGDISLCAWCGEVLVFDDDMKSRLATVAELMRLPEWLAGEIEHYQKRIRRERPCGVPGEK